MEVWKDVVGFEGLYQVSNEGKVYSFKTRKILRPCCNTYRNGYMCLILRKNGKSYGCRMHRLVAEAFIPNPNKLPEVNHKDENTANNRASNLEWCTQKYNNNYGTKLIRQSKHTNYSLIASKTSKKVCQVGLDGKTIKTWDSANQLKRLFGFDNSHIAKCCRGIEKTAYGFRWKYV